MGDEKFMLISLEDPKMKGLSEVLSNKTCKKIIDYLAENEEASQKDLSDSLDLPLNTVEYNIKKLVESGLVQKRKNFFWSKKGKKIVMYELSNKSIIISPKKGVGEKLKSLIPGFLFALVGSFSLWVYEKIKYAKTFSNDVSLNSLDSFSRVQDAVLESVPSQGEFLAKAGNGFVSTSDHVSEIFSTQPSPLWLAFLGGALIVLFVVSIINWRKL